MACSDPTTVDLYQIELVSGQDQAGAQGAVLSAPVVVRVLDSSGRPAARVAVEWRAVEGGGRLISADSLTDSTGEAQAQWELGIDVGQHLLSISVPGAVLTLRAQAKRTAVAVFAGGKHSCGLTSIGEAFCWGDNGRGQLGDGSRVNRTAAAFVRTGLRFRTLSLGWAFTCGITVHDELFCWGENSDGQIGAGTAGGPVDSPVSVNNTLKFATLGTGYAHACALTTDNIAYCWGNDSFGQSGNGPAAPSRSPVRVSGNVQFKQISAGEFHTCGVGTDSVAYCWGWNSTGEVGSGAAGAIVTQPAAVTGTTRFTHITAGVRHSCAIAIDGAAYCWGRNGFGETGTAPFSHPQTPLRVAGSTFFRALGAGNVSSCGTGSDTSASTTLFLSCWGRISSINFGPLPNKILTPTNLSVAVGYEHACTVQQGEIHCLGSNDSGQLGVTGIAESTTPVRVPLP